MIHKKISRRLLYAFVSVYFLFLLPAICQSSQLKAQKMIYSDLFAEPLLLNPATAGLQNCSSVRLNYTKTFGYDYYSASGVVHLTKINASLAALLTNLKEGDGILSTPKAEFIYAYRLPTNAKHKIQLALGAGVYKHNVNVEKIVYSGMINPFKGQLTDVSSLSFFNTTPKFLLEASFVYYSNKYRIGLSLFSEEKAFQTGNVFSNCPGFTTYFGRIFKTKHPDLFVMPVLAWSYASVNHQFYTGIRVLNKKIELMGMCSFQQNVNSLISTLGFRYNFKTFTLSYSYTNSYLIRGTTDIHQSTFGVAYNLFCTSKRKNNNTIYCSDF